MNKQQIIEYIQSLNDVKFIDIEGQKEKRLIFNNVEVFKIFGGMDEGCLNPFNDYTYRWLSSFFDSVVYWLDYNDFDDFEELENKINKIMFEWCDSEVSVYTFDLTKWLNDNITNVDYLTSALEEDYLKDGVVLLQKAQYKAVEELFNNALQILIKNLKVKFEGL